MEERGSEREEKVKVKVIVKLDDVTSSGYLWNV
jgi:hypothetical protein